MSRVGEKIKQARINLGLNQKQLAKKLGVAESFINDIELGRKIINEALMGKISKALGKDINDLTLSFEGEVFEEEKTSTQNRTTREIINNKQNKVKDKAQGEVNDVWNNAFGSVLKTVPIYKYNLKDVVGTRLLPVMSNKIEGHAQDKVFYLHIEDDEMIGFRIDKGDIAFAHITNELKNNSICLVEFNSQRIVRQIKKLDSSKVLLISNRGSIRTETAYIKDVNIIARLEKLEIVL